MSGHFLQNAFGKAIGSFGLNSFFVLSGFLITALLVQEKNRTGSVDMRAFYWRRTQRIFPVYYAFLAVVGIASLVGAIHIDPRTFLYDVFYVRDYAFNVPGDWWTGHAWSLAVEEQFYLIWPALLLFGGLRVGWGFALGCIVAEPFVRLGVYHFLPAYRPYIDIMLPTRIDTLMFGCALGIAFVNGSRVIDWFDSKRAGEVTAALTVATLLGVIVQTRYHAAYEFPIGITLQGLTATMLVLYLVKFSQTPTARFFAWRPLRELGRRSYSIYLWQQLFLTPHLNHTIFGRFPLNIVAAVSAGFLSYYLVERHYYERHTKKPVAAAPAVAIRAAAEADADTDARTIPSLGAGLHAADRSLEAG